MLDPRPAISRQHGALLLAASSLTLLLVILGGTVCATESGRGCPDWPGCYGQVLPPPQIAAVVEYTHRFVAALTSPVIIAAAVVSWRRTRRVRWISRPLAVAIVLLVAVVVFGAFAVLTGLPPGIAALDLGSALIVLALVVTATVVAFARRREPGPPDRLSFRTPFAGLSLAALVTTFFVLDSAVLVAGSGSITRCLGWPLLAATPADPPGWPQMLRLALAGVAGLAIIMLRAYAWLTQRSHTGLVRAATVTATLFVVEVALGVALLLGGENVWLRLAYVATAAALWAALVAVTVLAGLAAAAEHTAEPRPAHGVTG